MTTASCDTLSLPSTFATKEAALELASAFAHLDGTCLLFSGGPGDAATRSLLFLLPFEQIVVDGGTTKRCLPDGTVVQASCESNPWEALKGMVGNLEGDRHPEWVGYLGYEMACSADATVRTSYIPGRHPDALFQRCAVCAVFDHRAEVATVRLTTPPPGCLEAEQAALFEQLRAVGGWFKAIDEVAMLDGPSGDLSLTVPLEPMSRYCEKVDAALELIRAGEVYQVNVSQRCVVEGETDPYQLFAKLTDLNPAPFSAYLKLGDQTIVSSSPERFLSRQGDSLETRPIKGTISRGNTADSDVVQRETLLASEKDRAELMMITDLMRNDLGKISEIGSVTVPELIRCEGYTNVFHLLSIVTSQCVPGLHSMDAVRACFPGGSITGCPKLRAIEVIADLEKRRRGIYTGSIGYFCGNGDFDFNIAIRTLSCDGEGIEVQLGGAIVADSDAVAEYEETLAKGESIFSVLGVENRVDPNYSVTL